MFDIWSPIGTRVVTTTPVKIIIDEVCANFNMFHPIMLYRIMGDGHGLHKDVIFYFKFI